MMILAAPVPADFADSCNHAMDSALFSWASGAICGVAGGVNNALSFGTDPFGYIANALAETAKGLFGLITDFTIDATNPDLTVNWWTKTYAQAMAIGIVMFFALLAIQAARARKGQDWLLSTGGAVVAYMVAVPIAPIIGQMLVDATALLTKGIVDAYRGPIGDGVGSIGNGITDWATGAGVLKVLGGIAMLLMVIVSSFFLFISLVLQTMILYFAAAFFPIGFVWMASPHRKSAYKIPALFAGLCLSKPLLFLALGMGLGMLQSALQGAAGSAGKNIAMTVMACGVFMLAAFTPVLFMKLTQVVMGGGAAAAAGTVHQPSPRQQSGGNGSNGRSAGGGGQSQTSMLSRARAAQSALSRGGAAQAGSGAAGGAGSAGATGSADASTAGPMSAAGTANSSPKTKAGSIPPAGTGRAVGTPAAFTPSAAGAGGGATKTGAATKTGSTAAGAGKLAALNPALAVVAVAGSAASKARRGAHKVSKMVDGAGEQA